MLHQGFVLREKFIQRELAFGCEFGFPSLFYAVAGCDPVKPVLELRFVAKIIQVPVSIQKCFLNHVLGILWFAAHFQSEMVESTLIALH